MDEWDSGAWGWLSIEVMYGFHRTFKRLLPILVQQRDAFSVSVLVYVQLLLWYRQCNGAPHKREGGYNPLSFIAILCRPEVTLIPQEAHPYATGCWNHCVLSNEMVRSSASLTEQRWDDEVMCPLQAPENCDDTGHLPDIKERRFH